MVDGFILATDCGGGAGTGFHSWLPSLVAFNTCGVYLVPPFATVIIMIASDSGVTLTCP